jgi:transcriptional regulator with XRE-family HTH domain
MGMTAHADGDREAPVEPSPAANPLQRLIVERLRDRGWSYGEVARRGGLPRSTVYTLATTRNLVRPPRPATIDALAKGLDVPVTAVRAAAAQSTGLHYYDEAPAMPGHASDQERDLLIASIDELSPEDRRHVAALVESLRSKTAREDHSSGQLAETPSCPASSWYFLSGTTRRAARRTALGSSSGGVST